MTRRFTRMMGLGLLIALIAAAWTGGALGSRDDQLVFDARWVTRTWSQESTLERQLIVNWRLPRMIAAMITGVALAVSGLLLQGMTRNPLADPYLLGISGGAGLGVVLLHCLSGLPGLSGLSGLSMQLAWWPVPLSAFTGAIVAMTAVVLLARGGEGRISALGLILAGVVINALCAAVMALLLERFDPLRLRVTSTWLAGGIGYTRWSQLFGIGAVVFGMCLQLRFAAHRLNAFALGDAASFVGVDAERLMRRAAISASLLAALGVSLAGLLGFVGLIVPHVVRRIVGSDLRTTLPLSAMGGALLMLVADTVARVILAPEELPLGALTALLGCPVLLWQLRKQLRGVE